MRRPTLATLLVGLLLCSGCALFGLDCVNGVKDCSQFMGNCCDREETDEDFLACGLLFAPFIYPCGVQHGSCICIEGEKSAGDFEQSPAFASFGLPPFTFDVGLPYAGFSTEHRLVFDMIVGDQQTFHGTVVYAPGFTFHGFTALGPAGTQIGTYGFDMDKDGVVDVTLPLRALDADSAYVDINIDGQATVVDPTIVHAANVPSPGSHTFQLSLPAGGDMAKKLARVFRAFRIHASLASGIFTNPATPGSYAVTGTFTSVDPDTGDASDGTGQSPITLNVPPVAIAIDPSPLELLDHFLCYKTKASKGLVCNASATVNAGGLCASDIDCGGVAGACGKNKWPKGVQIALGDERSGFTPLPVDVTKPVRLCTPADKDGEGRHDTVTHLRSYAVKPVKGSPKRAVSLPLRIVNQLGTLAVQVTTPDSLLEPAAKTLGAPAAPLGANTVDRYQCSKPKLVTKRCAGDLTVACKTSATCGAAGP
ncbi:MAG: hypothetical protein ABI080_15705, partial [Candidatus Binatia bacterium]